MTDTPKTASRPFRYRAVAVVLREALRAAIVYLLLMIMGGTIALIIGLARPDIIKLPAGHVRHE